MRSNIHTLRAMFRQCLRTRSAKPFSRSNLIRSSADRHASSKPKITPGGRPSLSTRLRAASVKPFLESTRLPDRIWPTWRSTVKSFSKTTLGLFLFGHIVISYFYELRPCDGISMLPTLNSYGDSVLISKYYRRGRSVEVGDLISYHHPVEPGVHAVKRVLGLEGDFVLRDTPGTSGKMIQIPQGHCWVVGDNVTWSRDSRHFGPLPMALIRGKVVARYASWKSFGSMRNPLHGVSADEEDID